MLSALIFIAVMCVFSFLALTRGPFWGLLAYVNVYFNPPIQKINYWAVHLPFDRWSLFTSAILFISLFLHRNKVSSRNLESIKWMFFFTLISIVISYTYAPFPETATSFSYKLVTFCITSYFIVRSITNFQQYRMLCLFIIILVGNLSLKAYMYGDRVNSRLEGTGTADALGSNEFALLLINILPFTVPFIVHGKWYERLICLCCIPFMLNAFILCNSRGMAVALLLGLMTTAFILPDKTIRKYTLLVILAGVPTFIYLSDAEFIERMETLLLGSEAISDEEASAKLSSGRTVIWKYGYLMAKDHPLGAGPKAFSQLAHRYLPPEMLNMKKGQKGVRSAHNTYLQAFVEQGVIGLFVLLSIMYKSLKRLRSSIIQIQEANASNSYIGLSVLALCLSLSTTIYGGLTSSRIYYEFFWWQIALSIVLCSFAYKAITNTENPE